MSDFRHRALRHHSEGIELCVRIFGQAITVYFPEGGGRMVPVRWIAEQHVREDMGGKIPSAVDWLRCIQAQPWMNRPVRLSKTLSKEEESQATDCDKSGLEALRERLSSIEQMARQEEA